MDKILFVNSCVRPESRTMILAKRVLSKLDGEIEEVNLERENIAPLNRISLEERNRAVEDRNIDAPILRFARQFIAADVIVIAAPYWDLSIPALLKTYMENVNVCDVSFYYTPEGIPVGLVQAKKLIYVTTAGGPFLEPDHGFAYIKALAQAFYNIPEIICFRAENLDVVGADVPGIMAEAIDEIDRWGMSQ